jgi:hypothetical protein
LVSRSAVMARIAHQLAASQPVTWKGPVGSTVKRYMAVEGDRADGSAARDGALGQDIGGVPAGGLVRLLGVNDRSCVARTAARHATPSIERIGCVMKNYPPDVRSSSIQGRP